MAYLGKRRFRTLAYGSIPNTWKKAEVKPFYKKGSKLQAGNYRPVSILPVLSKILERAVNDQLNGYLVQKNLNTVKKPGYRQRKDLNPRVE